MQTIVTVQETAASQSFQPGRPAWVGNLLLDDTLERLERVVGATMRCPRCRRAGLETRPMYRPSSPDYRVVGVCPGCGFTAEI